MYAKTSMTRFDNHRDVMACASSKTSGPDFDSRPKQVRISVSGQGVLVCECTSVTVYGMYLPILLYFNLKGKEFFTKKHSFLLALIAKSKDQYEPF